MTGGWKTVIVAVSVLGVAAVASARSLHPQRRALRPSVSSSKLWPRPKVLEAAKHAFECGRKGGHFRQPLLTVIDYSLPSSEPRLWVIDLAKKTVLFRELVAHGRNSGEGRAEFFSDRPGSKMSSLGLYRTAETYWGVHGWALRLDGLEPGFNENARDRAIVLHGADYVGSRSIAKLGFLGRSWGCPAVRRDVSRSLINRIRGGTALFVYYPDDDWLGHSTFLRCGSRPASVASTR
jgi:hypothetical protein